MNNKAFTLAEVLITLGIIGIIAAMTIPNIIAGYRKNVVETRLAKLYSSINQAIKISEIKNGDCTYWEWGDINNHRDSAFMEQWWKKYMNDYMPYVIFTKRDSTQSSSISGNGGYKVFFKDGSALRIEAIPGTYAWFILYPEAKLTTFKNNQHQIIKEKAGRDYFSFYLWPKRKCAIETHPASKEDYNTLINMCIRDYNLAEGNGLGTSCSELILRNGWKIPDDYPIKF